jgi:5-methylcytosine-specific restriction endonuclease McrA
MRAQCESGLEARMTEVLEPHQRSSAHRPVLVLNQNYEPLNVCNMRRAMGLIFHEKAEVLEVYQQPLASATRTFAAPSVIRLIYMIKRPRPRVKLTRREVFIRDDYTCQYCGSRTGDLTIDHIIPRSRGGQHTWENLVSACKPCNHRKGGKTLIESRMRLRTEPHEPRAGIYYTIQRRLTSAAHDDWGKFIPGFESLHASSSLSQASD